MKKFLKITGVVAATGLALWAGSVTSNASKDELNVQVTDDGSVLHTGENATLDDVVEGSVSFIVNKPFSTIVENFRKPGTLGKISGDQVQDYTVEEEDTADAVIYHTVQTVKPFVPGFDPSKVGVDYFVNKRALTENIIFVKFKINEAQKGSWERLEGRIFAVDLQDGTTQVLLTTSTKSKYGLATFGVRQNLVERYLKGCKENIHKWLGDI